MAVRVLTPSSSHLPSLQQPPHGTPRSKASSAESFHDDRTLTRSSSHADDDTITASSYTWSSDNDGGYDGERISTDGVDVPSTFTVVHDEMGGMDGDEEPIIENEDDAPDEMGGIMDM
jgi:hypothetical protein